MNRQSLPALAHFEAGGLQIDHNEMPNGEKRYYVYLPGGSTWIYTITHSEGGWQHAHLHQGLIENYVVESGWIAVATCYHRGIDGGLPEFCPDLQIYCAGQSFHFGVDAHNLFVPPYTSFQTIKTGTPIGNPEEKGSDWWSHEELDDWCRGEEAAALLAEKQPV